METVSSRAARLFAVPDVAVSKTGSGEEARGLLKLLKGLPTEYQTTLMRQQFEALGVDTYWETWVGFWADWGSIGEPVIERSIAASPGELPYDTDFRVESKAVEGGRASLRLSQAESGVALNEAISAMMGESSDSPVFDFERVVTRTVETDPSTLLPESSSYSLRVKSLRSGIDTVMWERKWSFQWDERRCA